MSSLRPDNSIPRDPNGFEHFRAWHWAESYGSEVRITDRRGDNGQIKVETSGAVIAAPQGIDSILGVNSGRRYALTFLDSVNE